MMNQSQMPEEKYKTGWLAGSRGERDEEEASETFHPS